MLVLIVDLCGSSQCWSGIRHNIVNSILNLFELKIFRAYPYLKAQISFYGNGLDICQISGLLKLPIADGRPLKWVKFQKKGTCTPLRDVCAIMWPEIWHIRANYGRWSAIWVGTFLKTLKAHLQTLINEMHPRVYEFCFLNEMRTYGLRAVKPDIWGDANIPPVRCMLFGMVRKH